MFCSKCGSEMGQDAKFCGKCGNTLGVEVDTHSVSISDTRSVPKFSFAKTLLRVSSVLAIAFISLFWLVGSFDEDVAGAFIGVITLSLLFGILGTFIIRGMKGGTQEAPSNSGKQKVSFLGGDTIIESDTEESKQTKKRWNNFIKIFWSLFFLKLASHGAESIEDEAIILILFLLQFVAIGGMVITMGYYSYKFSGKKSYCLFGLLGFIWIAIIGIFIGYWQVQRLKNEKLGIKVSMKSFRLSR